MRYFNIEVETGRNFLSSRSRLLNKNDFRFVFKNPKKVEGVVFTIFSRSNQLKYPRIGLIISKRYVRHACDRNRIKRYARETFRLNQKKLLDSDFIVVVRSKIILYFKNCNLIEELNNLWDFHHQI